MNGKDVLEETFRSEVSEIKEEELGQNETAKEKLKRYYKSQDKLVPLFDDPAQCIDTCYIRLVLLDQQQSQQRKGQMNSEEDREWPNALDYSLLHQTAQETVQLENIWNDEASGSTIRHISIRGEAGSGKSVLTQRIAHLWANNQMWNDRFQWILQIPLRKIVNIFDDSKNDDIESQWFKIISELHIPEWDQNDINCILYSMDGLLLLDGFDEIADELQTNIVLQRWLQHCFENNNWHVIMTSRPNATCSHLNNPRMLNVIGFQSQDIQKYVCGYFQNITSSHNNNNSHANALIQKLNHNPSLKLLSHTPLYLRLFCYLERQQITEMKEEKDESLLNTLDDMSLSKLYEKLLESYMKWNWTKYNGTKFKLNEQLMFNIFEMEISYLSHIAWEGLKRGQVIISCEIQQRVLDIIKRRYPRKCISIISQWSRINSFGFLQGQESTNTPHPVDSVYFPHLTFQEWLAAYYLVNCLYEPVESDNHQQVRSILINEQLTPKYAIMISFMAGILYNNIENQNDPSGSGLLYFWKLLHSSPPQIVPIYQLMFYMRCLDACKADTSSSFLPSQLQVCHKSLIDSFQSWLIAWISFDKDKSPVCFDDRILKISLNNLMQLHLPNFQYLFLHSDIHLYITDQIKAFQTQLNTLDDNGLICDRLRLLSHLCVSTHTSNIIIQCVKCCFRNDDFWVRDTCEATLCAISAKLNEKQLDNVLEFLIDGLHNKDKGMHERCGLLLSRILVYLNERQLNVITEQLMNRCKEKKNHICYYCAKLLSNSLVKLNERQFNDIFEYLMKGFNTKDEAVCESCAQAIGILSEKYNKKQLDDSFECVMKRSKDKETYVREACAEAFRELALKLDKEQLDIAFEYLKEELKDERFCYSYIRALEKLSMRLDDKQLEDIFQHSINGLKKESRFTRLLETFAMKFNKKHWDTIFEILMDGFQNKNGYDYKTSSYLIEAIPMKLGTQKCNDIFRAMFNGLKNNKAFYPCATAFKKLFPQLDERQLDDFFKYSMNYLRYETGFHQSRGFLFLEAPRILNESSCAKMIGTIVEKLSEIQINDVFKILMKKLEDKHENIDIRSPYAQALSRMSAKLNDKQLCIFVKSLLEAIKSSSKEERKWMNQILLTISDDIWKRVTICVLKGNMKKEEENSIWEWFFGNNQNTIEEKNKEMQTFTFGLLIFNPRIQLNFNDDNIDSDALNHNTNGLIMIFPILILIIQIYHSHNHNFSK
ncbi:NACHT family NTPase, partial [Reticulomyxa filosa]